MVDDNKTGTEARAVAEIVANLIQVREVGLGRGDAKNAGVLAVPKGIQLTSVKAWLDEYLERPERKRGVSEHHTLESFVAHVKRHKNPRAPDGSVLFGRVGDPDDGEPSILTCVYDYHGPGCEPPDWGRYRAAYTFPFSEEWKAWSAVSNKVLSQEAFAEFLEERIADVTDPAGAGDGARNLAERLGTGLANAAQLMTLSRGLTVNVGRRVTNAQVMTSGEGQIAFQESHSDETGKPLRVPAAFEVAIPVFDAGGPWQLPVRLRYRVNEGKISWRLQPYRMTETLRGVMHITCEQAAAATGLPLFWGEPEMM